MHDKKDRVEAFTLLIEFSYFHSYLLFCRHIGLINKPLIPFGFRKYNINMYFICICKHHTLKKGFLRMSCRKSYTTCFPHPLKRDLDGLTTLKKNTTRQVKI